MNDGVPAGENGIVGVTNLQYTERERALSNFDMTHKFRSSFSYDPPFGHGHQFFTATPRWMDSVIKGYNLSGTFSRSSGYPGVVYMGNSAWYTSATGGSGNDGWAIRPDRVAGSTDVNSTWRDDPFRRTYFDPLAFSVPGSASAPAPGNSARTLGDARSLSLTTLDMAAAKNIRLFKDGKVTLQIRADAFNILNHPVFFLNPNSRSSGVWEYLANTRSFRPNPSATAMDPNNTGQFGNYAGRAFRLGARIVF